MRLFVRALLIAVLTINSLATCAFAVHVPSISSMVDTDMQSAPAFNLQVVEQQWQPSARPTPRAARAIAVQALHHRRHRPLLARHHRQHHHPFAQTAAAFFSSGRVFLLQCWYAGGQQTASALSRRAIECSTAAGERFKQVCMAEISKVTNRLTPVS